MAKTTLHFRSSTKRMVLDYLKEDVDVSDRTIRAIEWIFRQNLERIPIREVYQKGGPPKWEAMADGESR